ncbi:MAG: TolC family protein [Fibrobacteria bacterium]
MLLLNTQPSKWACVPLLLLALSMVEAQAQAVRAHTLKEALDLLEKQGAPWQSLDAEQAESIAESAGSQAFRNPELSYAREDLSEGDTKAREWTIGIRKEFASPGVYLNRRAARKYRGEALKNEFARKREEARGELRQTYLEGVLKQEESGTLQSLTGLVAAMVKAGQARFEEQAITSFEMFRLSSAQARVRELEAKTRNEYSVLTRRLAAWLYPEEAGITDVVPADKPSFQLLVMDSASLVRNLEGRSPDLKALESRVLEAEAGVRESRYGQFPEFSLSGGWKSQSDGLSGPALEISAPIPLLNWNAPERALRNAQAKRAKLAREFAKRSMRDDLELSLERLKTLEERLREYESLHQKHPFASMTSALEASYAEGRSPAFEVLDGLFGLHESLIGYHQALLDREMLNIHVGILVGGNTP